MENSDKYSDHLLLISKVLAGEASENEKIELQKWKDTSEENANLFYEYEKSWAELEKIGEYLKIDVDAEWKHFENSVFTDQKEVEKEPKILQLESHSGKISSAFLKIAAILIIGLLVTTGIFYFGFYESGNRLVADANLVEGELPDGSKVTLNRKSELSYPEHFDTDVRKVKLKGEGYFEVAHEPAHPFMVEAGNTIIQVLGTKFYVNASNDDGTVEVIVNSGRVAVWPVDFPENKIILKAGNRSFISNNQTEPVVDENTDENFLSWKTRKLIFNKQSLGEIIAKINHVYGSNWKIKDNAIEQCTLTVTFDDQSIDAVRKVLEATMDIQFLEVKEELLITGEGC